MLGLGYESGSMFDPRADGLGTQSITTNLVFQSTRAFDDERRKRRPERARREEPTPGAE